MIPRVGLQKFGSDLSSPFTPFFHGYTTKGDNLSHSYIHILFFCSEAPLPIIIGDAREALQLLDWHGIVHATGPGPFRHCSRPNTHLNYMPQCEVTPEGFANC